MLSRRDFLKGAITGLALTTLSPSIAWATSDRRDPILVVLHLTGGNDALNTLVPFKDPTYRRYRPQLALNSKNLLTITSDLALHPSLGRLASRFERGQVKLLPGIGRPDHDRSHFRSSDLWHCAGHPSGDGWLAGLGRLIESQPVSLGDTVSRAVACPGRAPLGILGKGLPSFPGTVKLSRAWRAMMADWDAEGKAATQLKSSSKLLDELSSKLAARMNDVDLNSAFHEDDFGHRFETTARMIGAGFPSRIYHIGAGRFDTHSAQLGDHAEQLRRLDTALEAFLFHMSRLGHPVVVVVYSEFGRRVAENFAGGTDHGAGGLAWMVGESVSGGVGGPGYGLDNLDDGDIRVSLDYRTLYQDAVTATFGATTAQRWSADESLWNQRPGARPTD